MRTPTVRKHHLLIAAALATGLSVPQQAIAAPPPGSYQQSCYVITASASEEVILTANCRKKDSDWLKGDSYYYNQNWSYKYCLGDISNQDGYLSCTFDKARYDIDQQISAEKAALDAAQAQATPAIVSAAVTVLGRKPSTYEIRDWTSQMRKTQPAVAGDGISFPEAVNWLKVYATQPFKAWDRAKLIDAVFREVHGRTANTIEQATYDALMRSQQAWYSVMVTRERDKLHSDPAAHAAMITAGYMYSFGRAPSDSESSYWQGRSESFFQLISANRSWLYSTAGAAELSATVARAKLAAGLPASDSAVKAAMPGYATTRRLFAEMK